MSTAVRMAGQKENALKLVGNCESAEEINMLDILPYVKPADYCFHVFKCKLDKALSALKNGGYLGESCLLITSKGALGAAEKYLEKPYYYAYITNTKTDELDEFVEKCTDTSYVDIKNKDYKIIKDNLAQAKQTLDAIEQNGDDNPNTDVKLLRSNISDFEKKLMGAAFVSAAVDKSMVSTVVALGGGVAMDAGQYIATHLAKKWEKPLNFICVPTVLSVNAAFCYKAAMRVPDPEKGGYKVQYDSGLVQPDVLIVDPRIVLTAGELNVVGSGDLLSCLTASFDWKLNSLVARNYKPNKELVNKPFNQEICTGAMELIGLLGENIDCLNAMRDYAPIIKEVGDNLDNLNESQQQTRKRAEEGLTFLLNAYHWVAEQSWIMQHTMWESASEHGMFDYMEHLCGTEFTHGQIIGLCVYFMSLLQVNEHARATKMIQRLKLDITLNDLAANSENNDKITLEKLEKCLKGVKDFLTEEDYRYTIISAKDMNDDWITYALNKYYHDFPFDPSGKPNKGIEKYFHDYAENGVNSYR